MNMTRVGIISRMAAFVVLVSFVGVAQAQRGGFSPEQQRERAMAQAQEMVTQLELSEEQAPKFMEIMETALEKRLAFFEEMRSGGGGFQGMREKMQELNEDAIKTLEESGVLTSEQFEKYKEILASRPQMGRRRQG